MPRANLHVRAKSSALSGFLLLFHRLFWDFSSYFCELSQKIKAFLRKKRSLARFCARHNGVNTLCAHKFLPFVRRRKKKKAQSRARSKESPRHRHATVHSHQRVVAFAPLSILFSSSCALPRLVSNAFSLFATCAARC